MSEKSQTLTELESLHIIQTMIASARQEQKDDGMGWIIWGWMLFLASVFTIINIHVKWTEVYFFWNIFGIATLVMLVVLNVRRLQKRKRQRVKTYISDLFQKLNIGFAITLVTIIVAINVGIHPKTGFALLLALYGFWILIYGALFSFRPSEIAAYFVWALGVAGLFVPTFEWIMVLHAIAVFVGYIIPGHIANKAYRQVTGRQNDKKDLGV